MPTHPPRASRADDAGSNVSAFMVPEDLATALAASDLRAAFDGMAFSHENEYLRWIDDAKKPATRRARIAGTIERIAAKRPAP